ncbi:MAG: nucleotidyltransferase family protein [Ruminococcaceae bacterium]|nr:nucleotidyltransferase family protein [Oscillospiraceae bacterium]
MSELNVCGIICEYNPFHIGHEYQLAEAKKQTSADYMIVVMSGNFVQRGEPAVFDKWARAEMALKCGADMVLELPSVYALSSAEYFAAGAVDILNKTGVVTHISFGSESFEGEEGAIRLQKIADETINGPCVDKESLEKGCSFASASRNSAITMPNDILATEYLRALRRLGAEMKVVPVKRIGSGHTGEKSAMFIRKLLCEGEVNRATELMPQEAAEIIQREIDMGKGPVFLNEFDKIILADLRRLGTDGLKNSPFVSEGLEYKIYKAACENGTVEGVIRECTSKRYTSSRIRRIILSSSLGIARENLCKKVPYIRLLGMRRDCGALMEKLKSCARVPVITSKAKFIKQTDSYDGDLAKEFLKIENNAADLYSLAFSGANSRLGATEMTHPLVFV